jgi:hypothetical protein
MRLFDPEYIAIALVALYFFFQLMRSDPGEKRKKEDIAPH